MEITKMSTKGQIVIPKSLRKDFKEGDAFVVSKVKNMIVLKRIEDLEREELDEIWDEIDTKELMTYSEETLKEMWDNKEDEIWEKYLE